jgi:hypothetical protein
MRKSPPAGLALLMVLAVPTHAAGERADFPGIAELMSPEEFDAAGLGRLQPGEIRALDAWLLRYTAGEASILQETNAAVQEASQNLEIRSRLVGDFDGWDGKTLFTLENGQVWKQRLSGRYRYDGPAEPMVVIDRNALGFYRLTMQDGGRSVGVTRVR